MNIISFFTTGKYWLIAIAVAFAAGGWIGWHERFLREPAMIEAQKTADVAECKAAQIITKEANNALQKNRDAIIKRLTALKLQPASCMPVSGSAELRGSGREHAGQNGGGLSSDWLRDYAGECELYRSEVIACIDFLKKERGE